MSANTTIAGSLVPNGTVQDISYVPNCSDAVVFGDYSLTAAAAFDPRKWAYYKVPLRIATILYIACAA